MKGFLLAMGMWAIMAGVPVAVLMSVPPAQTDAQLPGIVLTPEGEDPNAKLPRYDDLREAALVGAGKLYACSHYYECGGIIAQDPSGKYVLGPHIVSIMHGDEVQIGHAVPPGWKFVAEFHSHPCLPESHEVDYFSPQDLIGYISEHVTGYMLDLCKGDLHEFVPGRDSPNDTEMAGNPGIYSTHGRIVGHIPVDGKSVEPNQRP